MKKILLLGGSAQQVVAIRTAKEMGYYTVLCDYLPDNPGQYVADKYYNTSTTDIEAVYKIAKEENVEGVLAYASDPAAYPASVVCERLGLPTNPSKSVAILGVKHLFRDFLESNNFACPQHISFPSEIKLDDLKDDIKNFHFPIIIKPTDSSGSKGVTKLLNLEHISEAVTNAESYSRNKILIAEEFIDRGFPEVIGGDIFVWNGKVILWGEMSCFRDNKGKGLIPIGKKWPSGLTDSQVDNVHKELQRIVDVLNIRFGELNIEILLDKEDKVHFLELGPRAGGNMIPIQLSDAFNINLVKANISAAMGEEPDLVPIKQSGCYMHYVLHSYSQGKFKNVFISPEIEPFVYRQKIYKKEGDEVEYFDGAGKALGIIFMHFETNEQMLDFCRRKDDLVKINLL